MTVLVFLKRHTRASARASGPIGARAASIVSISAVRPAFAAVGVAKITHHQSDGMLSRCHHFETARSKALISSAIALREGHSSMTARNEFMPPSIRQSVLNCKGNLGADCDALTRQNVLMPSRLPASEFKRLFCARTALARERAGYTQATMAEALGMAQGTYHKYEKRSPLPHHLVPQFCLLCEIGPQWLYSAAVDARVLAKPAGKRTRRVA